MDGGTAQVPTMSALLDDAAHVAGKGYQAAALPYDGDELSMVLVVPDRGTFRAFEKGLTGRIIIVGDYLGGFVDDVIIEGEKGTLKLTGGKIELHKNGKVKAIPMDVPKKWPNDPCNNFAGLLDGRYKENCVDGILGARVAMLTETLLESGRKRRMVECKDILKRDGLTYRDIR